MTCYYTECEIQKACRRGYVSMNIYNANSGNSCGCGCGCGCANSCSDSCNCSE